MPSNSLTHSATAPEPAGTLYVVATPIGNRDDITLRALKILESVDFIAAEDTRHTGRFLKHHGISGNFISYHEHNEDKRTPGLLKKLESGSLIALVTSAGTPSVSDPGFRLIKKAIETGISVVPIPGVSAAITALSVAGMATDTFVFIGFLPKKTGKRINQLKELAGEPRTLILYESPNRIVQVLENILAVMGDRFGVLAREMTKLHEEFLRGSLSELLGHLKNRPQIKGECTLLISGRPKGAENVFELAMDELKHRLENNDGRLSELAKEISKRYSLSKKKVYDQALKLNKENRR